MNNQEKNKKDEMEDDCPLCNVSAETLQNLKQGSQDKKARDKQTKEKQPKEKKSFFRRVFKK